MKSQLAKYQPNPVDAEQIKRDAWNDDRILVIKAGDERLGWDEMQMIVNIGNRIYGKKRG